MSKQKSHQSAKNVSVAARTETNGMAKSASANEETPEGSEQDIAVEAPSGNLEVSSVAEKTAVKSGTLTNGKPKTAVATKANSSTTAKANTTAKAASSLPHRPAVVSATPRPGVKQSRDNAKYERRQAERQSRYLAERRAKRTKTIVIASSVLVVLVIASLVALIVYNTRTGNAQTAATSSSFVEPIFNTNYPPVDNIYCDALEGSTEHIHAHLSIYINGTSTALPAGVGIPTNSSSGSATCYYWLHTHDASGIIHIEAPVTQPFKLGHFFDEWNQQFQSLGFPSQLLLTSGWKIWVNGKVYNGPLAGVPLNAHDLVTIAYGDSSKVHPDTTYNWGSL